jgi:hypothetical protein
MILARAAAAVVKTVVLSQRRHRVPGVDKLPLAVAALPEGLLGIALDRMSGVRAMAGPSGGGALIKGPNPEARAKDLVLQRVRCHLCGVAGAGALIVRVAIGGKGRKVEGVLGVESHGVLKEVEEG